VGPLIPYFDVPIFQIGPLPIHGFGILVALGFVIGGHLSTERAKRLGLDADIINRLIGWLVVGTFVGGKLGYGLMYDWEAYSADPSLFLYPWGGLSSFGGFLVCVPLSVIYFRVNKVPVWPYVDCLAYGLTIGWFLGRMGCTVAHDHPGTPADDFFLGIHCRPVEGHTVEFPAFMVDADHSGQAWGPCRTDPNVVAAHDMGFYEALWSLSMYGVFRILDRVPRTAGIYALLLGAAYGPVRFAMDFLRSEATDGRIGGFTPGQWWSLVFFVVCVGLLIWRVRSGDMSPGTVVDQEDSEVDVTGG
jgi:phosphatidylglycerol:prolipoprotein diacylglycerol transferase